MYIYRTRSNFREQATMFVSAFSFPHQVVLFQVVPEEVEQV